MERVTIMGTGGFAIELAALLRQSGRQVVGFIGPEPGLVDPSSWLGDDRILHDSQLDPGSVLVAVGAPRLRSHLSACVCAASRQLGTFVHPSAIVADDVMFGPGAIVYPHSTIHAAVKLGQGVVINSNVTIGHETRIGDFSNVNPGACLAGRLVIGSGVVIGIGASLIEGLTVVDETIVGAGAVLIRDVTSPGTWAGVPARQIRICADE